MMNSTGWTDVQKGLPQADVHHGVVGALLLLFGKVTIYSASSSSPVYFYFFPEYYPRIGPFPPEGGSITDTYILNYAGAVVLLGGIALGLVLWRSSHTDKPFLEWWTDELRQSLQGSSSRI